MDELRFDDRVAIVTGGGRGLGRAHALLLAARGARVVVNDVGCELDGRGADPSPAREVVAEIAAAGGEAVAHTASVATADGGGSLVATALERFGRLDIVVSNAGILTHGLFADASVEELERHLAVDPVGSFNVVRAAWPHLREQAYGRIVITTTTASLGGLRESCYGTAKGAAVGLGAALAAAGAEHGIKVNSVAPYGFSRMTSANPRLTQREIDARARLAPPERVSALVAVLAHERCPDAGRLFVAGGGRVSRIVTGATPGIADADPTAEEVRDRWEEIRDVHGFAEIADARRFVADFYASMPRWPEGTAA